MKLKIKLDVKTNKRVSKRNKYAIAVEEKGLSNLRKLGYSDGTILIIERLEFWFKKYPDYFDKHFEDRKDQRKLDGECLSKELDMKKGTFNKYFAEIGNRYLTPEEYLSSPDIFGHKLYCSVLDGKNHDRTRYYRNHQSAQMLSLEEALSNQRAFSNHSDRGLEK